MQDVTGHLSSVALLQISSLVQFLTENCCKIFGEEINSLFGEILMTCKRENGSGNEVLILLANPNQTKINHSPWKKAVPSSHGVPIYCCCLFLSQSIGDSDPTYHRTKPHHIQLSLRIPCSYSIHLSHYVEKKGRRIEGEVGGKERKKEGGRQWKDFISDIEFASLTVSSQYIRKSVHQYINKLSYSSHSIILGLKALFIIKKESSPDV